MSSSLNPSSPTTLRPFRTTIIDVEEVPVVPLTYPQKVTAQWIWAHVPISVALAIVAAVFGAGMSFQKMLG